MDMTWDLSVFYKGFDDPQISLDMEKADALTAEAAAELKSGKPVGEVLEHEIALFEQLQTIATSLSCYSSFTLAVDATNPAAAQVMDQLMVKYIAVQQLQSALSRYLGGAENLDQVIAASPKLTQNAFVIKEMADQAKHMIPEAIEPVLLKMSLSGGEAFSQLRDKLDATMLVDYDGKQIPLSAARAKAYSGDAAVRRAAYEAELAAYKKVELPMSYCLNSIKAEAETRRQVCGFDSVLDQTLYNARMDRATLDALLDAIRDALPDFRRYLRAKGKVLGHKDGIPFYDLFAPVGKGGRTYTVEEAEETLLREMGKFQPAMADFIKHAFENRWIDMLPHEGKSGGAFCGGAHHLDISRILTNFEGNSLSDVSTLAHELGHAWHNRCMKGLPVMLTDAPMPLAETASIFNETMLSHQVMKNADKRERFTLLEADLMEATQTVVDIYSRFLFEQSVIEGRMDHTLSSEELCDLMLDAQEKSYGDGLDKEYRHPYMWACKSHYYSPTLSFYNFPYAFGLLFGKGVFAKYLAEGEAFVPKYNALLRRCGSDTVANVAASVGIDVRDKAFWESSLNIVRADIDEFVKLCDEQ